MWVCVRGILIKASFSIEWGFLCIPRNICTCTTPVACLAFSHNLPNGWVKVFCSKCHDANIKTLGKVHFLSIAKDEGCFCWYKRCVIHERNNFLCYFTKLGITITQDISGFWHNFEKCSHTKPTYDAIRSIELSWLLYTFLSRFIRVRLCFGNRLLCSGMLFCKYSCRVLET